MQSILQYRRIRNETKVESDGSNDPYRIVSRNSNLQRSSSKAQSTRHIDLDEDDPHRPRNWSRKYKIFASCVLFTIPFVAGWASAADSSLVQRARVRFHVGQVPETLSTALFLFGAGLGALFVGPISEVTGRNAVYFISGILYLLALLGAAAAPNYATHIIMRFFAGVFGSPGIANSGGSLSDMFETNERAIVWPIFALSSVLNTLIPSIPNGWIENSSTSWRWGDWITLIISGAAFLLAFFFLPETYVDTISSWKAHCARGVSGDHRWRAFAETSGSLSERLSDHAFKMSRFLTREPITVFFGLYLTLLFVLVFTFLHGFTYIFGMTYGWIPGQVGSCFGAVCVGVLLGVPYVLAINIAYNRRRRKTSDVPTPTPESRLISTVTIAPLLPISLFWLAFTNRPDISPFSSLGACTLFGFCFYIIFTTTYHYMIDAYSTSSSSALAAVTFMRYYGAGGMDIAAIPMYDALGVKWTMVLMGCVATVLTPVPLIFWYKGKSIRERSRFAEKGDLHNADKDED